MKRTFSFGGPEMIGLAILGATIGAVLGGAGLGYSIVHPAFYAIIGAIVVPLIVIMPWMRLARLVRRSPARGSKLA